MVRTHATCALTALTQVDAFGNRSMTIFVARSFEYYLRATVLLASLPWVRHQPGMPDCGQLWCVMRVRGVAIGCLGTILRAEM